LVSLTAFALIPRGDRVVQAERAFIPFLGFAGGLFLLGVELLTWFPKTDREWIRHKIGCAGWLLLALACAFAVLWVLPS
jgi:hypothetical protein